MMSQVSLPLWLVIIGGALAVWALVSRFLLPSVRWFFQRRANRVIDELNKRTRLKLPHFALTRRRVLVDRLVFDPKVIAAVAEHCQETGEPRQVAVKRVERYAREIVPAFNAYMYFRVGSALAKRIARSLYRVRMGYADSIAHAEIPDDASVVFVMNHRSNMDYVLVTYLAQNRVALSYAVGEWARVWPVQQLISTLGAYFVRRNSGDRLYRRVLERYVQMAVAGGAVQAMFPEGGLSRDGLMRKPKIGLIDYMLRDFDPNGERDLLFVPVGINYDRVLEDRTLVDERPNAERRSGFAAMRVALGFVFRNLWLMLRRRWHRLGYACANFGTPVSMKAYMGSRGWDLRDADREERGTKVTEIAQDLLNAVGDVVPVLPVSVVAEVLRRSKDGSLNEHELKVGVLELFQELRDNGAQVYIPRGNEEYAYDVGLRMLTMRHMVSVDESGDRYSIVPDEARLLAYYANAIAHFTPATAA